MHEELYIILLLNQIEILQISVWFQKNSSNIFSCHNHLIGEEDWAYRLYCLYCNLANQHDSNLVRGENHEYLVC